MKKVIFEWEHKKENSYSTRQKEDQLLIYEDAEWVVNSIKDYKDEYQEVRCSKIRGKRHSRRLAHG